tara:strand:+ start:41390 stop:42718 length:1329 start_codon:yes stop_codon:yes gene_type:complete
MSKKFFEMYPDLTPKRLSDSEIGPNLVYNQKYYFNSNLPNLENIDGLYIPKGFGQINGFLFTFNKKYFELSFEPQLINQKTFEINIPDKKELFSKLNDVPLNQKNDFFLKNTGFKIFFKGISAGYGNWNDWWGPGIHNSLTLSNNALGFYNYFVGTDDYLTIFNNIKYKIKYTVSDKMKNFNEISFFLSSLNLNIKYQSLEAGFSKNILSGGIRGITWNIENASKVIFTGESLKYWDRYNDFYILYKDNGSGTHLFYELGIPNRHFNSPNQQKKFSENAMSSNIGLRKYGAFDNDNIIYGLEYTRLVQGIYYNIIPTPNWYDNIKFDYSSYKGRRWASHSGTDSDDLLAYAGYINKKLIFIYGLNFERHGVTHHFPPEVKIERKISITYNFEFLSLQIIHENEYYEHYGFVDDNNNVWNETFEEGSIQRTQTLLIQLESKLF